MADEENPLGGGAPFGVGPFGPLVGVAAATAAAFSFVTVTTAVPVTRTLFYQAKIAPPVVPPPTPAQAETFSVVTADVRTKTLHYQSRIYGLAPPVVAVVDVTIDKWQQPFTRAVQRPPTETGLYTPFTPSPAVQPNVAWLQPFKRNVAGPFPVHTQPVLGVAVAPQPTPDEWLQPFQRAVPTQPVHHTQPVSGYQPEAVVSNLTTTLEWLQPFKRQVAGLFPVHTQPTLGYQPEAVVVSNLTTTLEWMVAWQKAVPAQPVHYTQPVHAQPTPNLTATLEWQVAWQKAVPASPVRHTQPVFGYPYPTVENTIAGLGWVYRFEKAVPAPPVHHTQPVHSLPQPNYRNEWDWPLAWNLAAKAPKPVHTQPILGYQPEAVVVSNLTTSIEWLQKWQSPPRPLQQLAAGPVLPPAATPTVANTITGIAWLQGWTAPPRYWPIKVQQTPFIPKEFVEDRITPDKWLLGFQRAKPTKPIHTQPFLGRSYAAPPTLEWLRGFDRAVAARPVNHTQPAFVYSPPAVVSNLTTTLEWQQPLSIAVHPQRARPTQPFYGYPYEVVAEEVTVIGGLSSITTAYPSRRTLFYQAWAFGYPYTQVVEVCIPAFQVELDGFQFDAFQTCVEVQPEVTPLQGEFSVTTAYPSRRTLFYQAHIWSPLEIASPPSPPLQGGVFSVTTAFPFGRSLAYQANVWAPFEVPPPPVPPEPEPPPPPPPKFSHGQIFSAGAQTGVAVVYPPAASGCIPGFYADGFQEDAFQVCHAQGTPPIRPLRTTRAMTSTRWKRSRGSVRSRGKSRTTPRDDP